MRSVFIHLTDININELTIYLNSTYPEQNNPWLILKNEDPVLYINHYTNTLAEYDFEKEEIESIKKALNGDITASLIIDVSGRHEGLDEVTLFLEKILTRFKGIAIDEYTQHPWSLEEIKEKKEIQDHPFFDYKGWSIGTLK
ncbi:hypothetical protein BVY03_00680 [bacterium K02(2017)]|nr:hypothetical protein BVY03_00680 [bacterium K02(2017)]